MKKTKHYPDFKCDLENEETKIEPDTKSKVDKAIIVSGTK